MTGKYDGYTFPLSPDLTRRKVQFHNRYGVPLVGDLYLPKKGEQPLAALAVAGSFGAVKEQCAGLYAQELALRGFAVLAFAPSFIGESGGAVRNVASPDINTEDFSAAVDFLATQDFVNPEQIGILGICGWGGMALNAAAMDTRVKATVTATMYDMTRVNAKGYFDHGSPGLPLRHLCPGRRGRRSASGGRPGLCEGLLRLLQNGAGLC